ncbi:E3 ubiquitin/ISG15 ligase TRIM25-like isoform X1 [Brienomyrus brachyistius]|uniref:E3 ubiquitin/ISG15 ligase TRIM25-like isoform X1 n=1 Tax=Brienomyrus brachyistius TaxID=42636 RepID=UPI0020B23743|nr:E3 ubiquitin/ISG15 ligase TRIM25-like isoform X1 [Brienomyrus brachyistius]
MADTGNLLSKVQFSCPICLDLLKDPVTLPCGHSYCMNCIKSCWDKEDLLGVYSCPQCRQTFKLRPDLKKSTILAEVVEKLKNTRLHATAPADHYAGPGDVECDFCTGRKHKAVKSCLVCLASYCESHLQPHYTSPAFKKHKLADATGHLQDKVCSQHDKLLEVYCRTDQQCVCLLCVMDEHRGHDTVSAAAGRTEKQKQQEIAQKEFQKWIQERENELQEMKKAVNALSLSAQSAVEESERTFTEMICSIERRRSEVTKLIRDQEKAAVNQAEGHMKRLEQEIDELKRKHSELEQLSHTEDHIHFLQGCQIPCVPLASAPLPSIPLVPSGSFENVKKALFDLKAQLERSCKDTLTGMSQTVKDVCVLKAKKCTSYRRAVSWHLLVCRANRAKSMLSGWTEEAGRVDGGGTVPTDWQACFGGVRAGWMDGGGNGPTDWQACSGGVRAGWMDGGGNGPTDWQACSGGVRAGWMDGGGTVPTDWQACFGGVRAGWMDGGGTVPTDWQACFGGVRAGWMDGGGTVPTDWQACFGGVRAGWMDGGGTVPTDWQACLGVLELGGIIVLQPSMYVSGECSGVQVPPRVIVGFPLGSLVSPLSLKACKG